MNIEGPWYGNVMVTEKIDGVPAILVIEEGPGGRARDAFLDGPAMEIPEVAYWYEQVRRSLPRRIAPGVYDAVWVGAEGRDYGIEEPVLVILDPTGYDPDDPRKYDGIEGLRHAPVLYYGPVKPENGQDPVEEALRRLKFAGSALSPGYKRPAGVIVTMLESGVNFSVDLD